MVLLGYKFLFFIKNVSVIFSVWLYLKIKLTISVKVFDLRRIL